MQNHSNTELTTAQQQAAQLETDQHFAALAESRAASGEPTKMIDGELHIRTCGVLETADGPIACNAWLSS